MKNLGTETVWSGSLTNKAADTKHSVKRVQVEGNIQDVNICDVDTGGKYAAGVFDTWVWKLEVPIPQRFFEKKN